MIMDRNYIASELTKVAREMADGDLWSDMPDRAGSFVKNRSRAMKDDKILEYASSGGHTVLIESDGKYAKWDLTDKNDKVIDSGKVSVSSVGTTLKGLSRMYKARTASAGALKYVVNGSGVTIIARYYYHGDLTKREANFGFDDVDGMVSNAVNILNKYTKTARDMKIGWRFKATETVLANGYFQGEVRAKSDDQEGLVDFLESNDIKSFR